MKKARKLKIRKQKESDEHVQGQEKKRLIKDITVKFDEFTETYEALDLTECLIQQTGQVSIKRILKLLQKSFNLSFLNKEIKYFLEEGQIWLSCPKLNMNIGRFDYANSHEIKLSALSGRDYIDAIMDQSDSDSGSESNSYEQIEADQKCRRLKQRKIKHVIEKVLQWRQFYAGIGVQEKVPLQEGAKRVNISKKTLDDYLSQIKKGKKYGFNFNEHKNEKIGVLRQFIRKAQKGNK